MARPYYRSNGKLAPAGEAPALVRAVCHGPMPKRDLCRASGAPERPCARCRRRFKPTPRRAVLCLRCFKGGDADNNRDLPA